MKYAVFIFLLSFGCATKAQFNKNLDDWAGHNVDENVIANGPPARIYRLDSGERLFIWYTGHTGKCQVTCKVDNNGIIQACEHKGGGCRA